MQKWDSVTLSLVIVSINILPYTWHSCLYELLLLLNCQYANSTDLET
jgi:hypothetical protein